MENRFFCHSFPRRRRDTDSLAIDKGLVILSSIVRSGFLLTPEMVEWREHLDDGTQSDPIQVFQKRVCFTELAPQELSEHGNLFGAFAIEFPLENLRLLGRMDK